MSPGIKLGISFNTRDARAEQRTPAQHVLIAVAAAHAKALKLRTGDLGVTPGMLTDTWIVDRGDIPAGVNVIGAVLLALQPTPIEDEDPNATAARALGVALAWTEGCSDGWDREIMASYWVGGTQAQLYLEGYEAGMRARFCNTIECRCGLVRFKGELACPGCGAR